MVQQQQQRKLQQLPHPRRRFSLQEQWDETTNVVDVKRRYHRNSASRYTLAQIRTFTKWINLQLRELPLDDASKAALPTVVRIDEDFRDGKKLLQLLRALYPEDANDLPKPDRGDTRHHRIANVTKVLGFVEGKLDETGLAAFHAIGPVDIVDGNVKLTLGLIWLMISKFHHHASRVFGMDQMVMEDDELGEGYDDEDAFDEPKLWLQEGRHVSEFSTDGEKEQNERDQKQQEGQQQSSAPAAALQTRTKAPPPRLSLSNLFDPRVPLSSSPISSSPRSSRPAKQVSASSIASTLPSRRNMQSTPKRFRTLNQRGGAALADEAHIPGLLFWMNVQLVDMADHLPSDAYPARDFESMDNGILLTALIHRWNKAWLGDEFDELLGRTRGSERENERHNDDDHDEQLTRHRLARCFAVIEEKVGVARPADLERMLLNENAAEERRPTGLAWSMYMSDLFLRMTELQKRAKEKRRSMMVLPKEAKTNDKEAAKEGAVGDVGDVGDVGVAGDAQAGGEQVADEQAADKQVEKVDDAHADNAKGEDAHVDDSRADDAQGAELTAKRQDAPLPFTSPSPTQTEIPKEYMALYMMRSRAANVSTASSVTPVCPLPLRPWSSSSSIVSAIWDWTISWLIGYNDTDDDIDDDEDEFAVGDLDPPQSSRASIRSVRTASTATRSIFGDDGDSSEAESTTTTSSRGVRMLQQEQQKEITKSMRSAFEENRTHDDDSIPFKLLTGGNESSPYTYWS